MLNFKVLRYDTANVAKRLAYKNYRLNVEKFTKQDKERKGIRTKLEKLQAKQNRCSRKIGLNQPNETEKATEISRLHRLKKEILHLRRKLSEITSSINQHVSWIPNIPDQSVPIDRGKNIEVFRWGNSRQRDFSLRNHSELGMLTKKISFADATKITGSKFVVMRGSMARLHRALSQFMLDVHTERHGYQEYYLPYLSQRQSLFGSGQLPKFHKELFQIQTRKTRSLFLIPTAEVPLINLVRDSLIHEERLPLKFVAHTPCFRSEAGSYGKKYCGLMRLHQFDKVELVQVVHPEDSMSVLEEITQHAENILQMLDLPYRKVLLCAGTMGFSSCKTYDLEVWFPACSSYYEVSSCSNTGDFQSRRINARFLDRKNNRRHFVHALNASGLAIGRTLAAILENHQNSDGSVKIPKVLRSYMGEQSRIVCP